jgi:DNA polymerase-3 subunit gamma/tau
MSEKKEAGPQFDDWFITYAPKDLSEIYGQDTIVNYYKEKIKKGKWDKSTFFMGSWGSGKTALAKIIAKHLACKHLDADGNPCNTCPTCLAVNNETFDRDVIYLNGELMSAGEVDEILNKSMVTPAVRDAAKVFIVDETQGLSPAAINKFLNATQSPQKGFFFIFTTMGKLTGKNPGALQSRCKQWKMKVPSNEEIYLYLANFAKTHKEIIDFAAAPKEFWGEGLKFIAENSESSFRKAVQTFQQCYDGKIFDVDQIKETFDIVSYDDAAGILANLAHGDVNKAVYDVIMGNDYQDKFGLLIKIIGDAATYKAFGTKYVIESDRWKWKNPAMIAEGAYFNRLCEVFQGLGQTAYIKRGDWQIALSNFISGIKPGGVTQIREVEQTLVEGKKVVARRSLVK